MTFDSKGNKLSEIYEEINEIYTNGIFQSETKYSYDSKGNVLTEERDRFMDGSIDYKFSRIYDKYDNLISEQIDTNGVLQKKTE